MEWISVSDEMPSTRRKVLVLISFPYFSRGIERILLAEYILPKTVLAEDYFEDYEDDAVEYDVEKDCEWVKSGWYEITWGELSYNAYLGGTVTHWMPLPDKPECKDIVDNKV